MPFLIFLFFGSLSSHCRDPLISFEHNGIDMLEKSCMHNL